MEVRSVYAGAPEGGTHMTPKRLSALLVLALAAIALTVCAGLAAKNIVDWIGARKNE